MRNRHPVCNRRILRYGLAFLGAVSVLLITGCSGDRKFDDLERRKLEMFDDFAPDPPQVVVTEKDGASLAVSRIEFPENKGRGVIRVHHYINDSAWEYFSGIAFSVRASRKTDAMDVCIGLPLGAGNIDEIYKANVPFILEPDRWYELKIPFQAFFSIRAGEPFPTTMLPRTTSNRWEVILLKNTRDPDPLILDWSAVTMYRDHPKFRFW